MEIKTIFISLAAIAFSLTACSGTSKNIDNQTYGKMSLRTADNNYEQMSERTLNLKNFHGLSVSTWVDVHYTQGSTYKVLVKGTSLAFKINDISVRNGILTVNRSKDSRNITEGSKITIYVTSPKMDYIENIGSTTFNAEEFNAGNLKIDNSGVLKLYVDGIKSTSTNIENSGSMKGTTSFSGESIKYDNSGVCTLTANFDFNSFSYDNCGSSK